MYTIGQGISSDDNYAKAILNPTQANMNVLRNEREGTDENNLYKCFSQGYYSSRGDRVTVTTNPYTNYSYADGSYVKNMSAEELTKILNEVINSSVPKDPITWNISSTEISAGKANLPDINISKTFTLTAGTLRYTSCQEAIAAGVLVGNETNGYYIDLTKVPAGSTVNVSYFAK